MRKIVIYIIVSFQLMLGAENGFAKHCLAIFEVGDTSFCSSLPINAELFFNIGDSINITASTLLYGSSGVCATCTTITSSWNGNASFNYLITDTGMYTASAYSDDGCFSDFSTLYLHIAYRVATDVGNQVKLKSLIYPSISTGIFNIKSSGKILKQFSITDSAGRIILSSANNFSEINLTNFSSGIYFYAITDEKENVWRGRIVKE